MLQTGHTISLPCGVNDIKSFAINGCDFYFLNCSGCKLIKWSANKKKLETILLEHKYLCICYDHKENCYWAIPEREPYLICRLDAHFFEVGYIEIKGACQQLPVSLCCDTCGNSLYICYPLQWASVEKRTRQETWSKSENINRSNLGLIVQWKCRASCYYEDNRETVVLTPETGAKAIELSIQKDYNFIGIATCCSVHSCKKCCFCILLSKPYSCEFMLVEYCIDFSNGIIEPPFSSPCPPSCPIPCPPSCPIPCPPSCPIPCPPSCPIPCPPSCSGNYEIMHSIALEEAGIAHILNAEGEKIQKAVASSATIEELICVNESVKHTLTQVTLLEGMLYSKLEALFSCHGRCKPATPNPHCPCPSPCPPTCPSPCPSPCPPTCPSPCPPPCPPPSHIFRCD